MSNESSASGTPITLRDFGKAFNRPTDQPNDFILKKLKGHILEVEDLHFHHDSAVFLPDYETADSGQDRITGLAVLRACYRHAEANASQKIVIPGHTDRSGSANYNLALSRHRADIVLDVLLGNRDEWVRIVAPRPEGEEKSKVEDYQRIIRWIARGRSWNCDPGAVDNLRGPKTKAALEGFQRDYNDEFSGSITVDGIVGPETWGAIFDVYMDELAGIMETDAAGLAAARSRLTFLNSGQKTVGCGENFPITAKRKKNYRSPVDRRVEILFFDPGEEPRLDCHPGPTTCDHKKCEIYNPKLYGFKPIVVEPLGTATVRLVEIVGLYKPRDSAASKGKAAKLSGYVDGYRSEDDEGRIFINHVGGKKKATEEDWQGTWKKDTQFIDLRATVVVEPNTVTLPPDAKLIWEWSDPDDPTNDDSSVRMDAGMVLDPNDYDAAVPKKLGSIADDNEGERDFPKPGTAKGAAFEELGDCTMKAVAGKARRCQTLIVKGESKVRLHCTNVGGDNFKVTVRFKTHGLIAPGGHDKTGVMTMWKRIDVEYVKMQSAHPIPVERISEPFRKAFVQFDIGLEREVPDIVKNGHKVMGLTERAGEQKAADYVTKSKGEFSKEGTPGWFFLAAANEESPLGSLTSEKVFDGGVTVKGPRTIVLDTDYTGSTEPDVVRIRDSAKKKTVLFTIDSLPNKRTIKLDTKGYYPSCKHGSITKMYSSSEKVTKDLQGYGFADKSKVEVVVSTPGSYGTGGISMDAQDPATGDWWFAGRTIIYTGWVGPNRDDLLSTTCHELTHGLGFAHICGHRDFQVGSDMLRCAMHYGSYWLLDESNDPIPWETGKESVEMCAPHIVNVRRTHLEDTPVYGW